MYTGAGQAMVADAGIAAELKWCDVKKADLRKLAVLVAQCDFEVSGKSTNKVSLGAG